MQIFKFIPAKIWADPCLRLTRVNSQPISGVGPDKGLLILVSLNMLVFSAVCLQRI